MFFKCACGLHGPNMVCGVLANNSSGGGVYMSDLVAKVRRKLVLLQEPPVPEICRQVCRQVVAVFQVCLDAAVAHCSAKSCLHRCISLFSFNESQKMADCFYESILCVLKTFTRKIIRLPELVSLIERACRSSRKDEIGGSGGSGGKFGIGAGQEYGKSEYVCLPNQQSRNIDTACGAF